MYGYFEENSLLFLLIKIRNHRLRNGKIWRQRNRKFWIRKKRKTLAQVFSCDCEISKNTFSCKTPLVAASGLTQLKVFLQLLSKTFFKNILLGVSPYFHCTILVPVYRVYTSCFHNTVASSCYRLNTSYLHHASVTCFSLSIWF